MIEVRLVGLEQQGGAASLPGCVPSQTREGELGTESKPQSSATSSDSIWDEETSLAGKLLVAMPKPAMSDPRFERSVIYVCAHSEDGAMGLVINKPAENITFPELLEQLNIDSGPACDRIRVHAGGPVDVSRGFVLHSTDYYTDNSTLSVTDDVGLTATIDILRAMAAGSGPTQSLFALGYAGWGAGQLEAEIKMNGWICCDPAHRLIFDPRVEDKWQESLQFMGINPAILSSVQGHA